jgi:hypothetical protein
MMLIPCRRGVIYPYGGMLLAVDVDGRPITANQLAASGVCRLTLDGDHEKTFTFDVADLDAVAKIVKPRKKRQMTETQKQAAAERIVAYQFKPNSRSPERSQRARTHAEVST